MTTRKRTATAEERRTHRELREALDELVQHIRVVRRTLTSMPPHELERAQDRLEWLADEVWRLALGEDDGPP